MATPRKNKSGTWSIRVYSHTDEQKRPHQKLLTASSKAEVLRKAALWTIDHQRQGTPQMTIKEATEAYAKDERLSPADRQPLASYAKHWEALGQIRIDALTDAELQRWVDSLTLAPSTVHTVYGYLMAAIHAVDRRRRFDVRLPRVGRPDTYTPSTDEIRALIAAAEGDLRLAVMLAAYCTLRRGEVLALERSDLEGGVLHVTKSMVRVKGGAAVKAPKTPGSVRDIPVPDIVRAEIESGEGRLVRYAPATLSTASGSWSSGQASTRCGFMTCGIIRPRSCTPWASRTCTFRSGVAGALLPSCDASMSTSWRTRRKKSVRR